MNVVLEAVNRIADVFVTFVGAIQDAWTASGIYGDLRKSGVDVKSMFHLGNDDYAIMVGGAYQGNATAVGTGIWGLLGTGGGDAQNHQLSDISVSDPEGYSNTMSPYGEDINFVYTPEFTHRTESVIYQSMTEGGYQPELVATYDYSWYQDEPVAMVVVSA